jgi:sugar lactone lactonase YvrE
MPALHTPHLAAMLLLSVGAAAQTVPNGLWVNSYTADHLVHVDGSGAPEAPRSHPRHAGQIAVATDGRVYSIAQATSELVIYEPDGRLVAQVRTGREPWGVAVDREGHVWVGCSGAGRLERYDRSGTWMASALCPTGIRALECDWLGNLWVASAETDEVLRYDLHGALHARIPVGDDPRYLALGHEGVLYVVNYQECSLSGIGLLSDQVWKTEGLPTWPGDVAVDSEAQVWVALGGWDRVRRLDRTLTYSVDYATGIDPMGVSVASDGTIWVASHESGALHAFRPDGTALTGATIGGKPSGIGDMTGLHALVNLAPRGDADHDGFENRNEWIGGSDALDALDVPCELTAVRSGLSIDLSYREPHRRGTWVCFFLTATPRPGESLALVSRGIDERTFPSNILDYVALVTLTVPEPLLFESFQGVSDATGTHRGRLHLPYAIPWLEIAAFSMDFDVYPDFVRTMHRAIAMP